AMDVALSYQFGLSVPKNISQSRKLWNEALQTDRADVDLGYARFLADVSQGTERLDEIRAHVEKAASENDPQAVWIAYGMAKQRKDIPAMSTWIPKLQELSAKGDSVSTAELADAYISGEGIETSVTKAYEHYQKAALQGSAYAKARAGELVLENSALDGSITR